MDISVATAQADCESAEFDVFGGQVVSADCTYFSGVATNVTIIPYNPLEHKYRHLPLTLIDAMHSHLKLCVSTDWNLLYLFGCLLRAASFLKCSLALAGKQVRYRGWRDLRENLIRGEHKPPGTGVCSSSSSSRRLRSVSI